MKEIDNMRARDLRRLLSTKLGVRTEEVAKILDRNELKELAKTILTEQQWDAFKDDVYEAVDSYKYAAITLLLLVMTAFTFRRTIFEWFSGFLYITKKKWSFVRLAIENGHYYGAFCFILSMVIECYQPALQMSVLAGWVIPRDSIFRFRVPTLSVPVNFNKIQGDTPRNDNSFASKVQSYVGGGLDIGPMVTIWGCNYLKNVLDNQGAASIHAIVAKKEAEKQMRKMQEDQARRQKEREAHEKEKLSRPEAVEEDDDDSDVEEVDPTEAYFQNIEKQHAEKNDQKGDQQPYSYESHDLD